eukprot:10596852-Karenia_brevis.AAC.1
MLQAVGGDINADIAPDVYQYCHNEDSQTQIIDEIIEFYQAVYQDAPSPARPPTRNDVKTLLLSLGNGRSFRTWHSDILHNANPPQREAPAAFRYQQQIRSIQLAISKAFPHFLPPSEDWPGQATAIACSIFCQTIEDNCLALAED